MRCTQPETIKIKPVSFSAFCQGWKRAKEKTSSVGPHFGHYKAGVHHTTIANLLYQRSILPMITGYSPKRHKKGTDVMLLKKENVFDVERLRTIVLFDTKANMNNKHTGKRAMDTAIAKDMIAIEQYSRPNRKAIDHSINHRLVLDHQYYLRQPFVLTSCDLKSCYDRINHTAASLSLQKVGIPQSKVTAMLSSIQNMSHRVRTAYGDSDKEYGWNNHVGAWKLPPQGVLQGNGCGPAIWTIISSFLFSILGDKGFRNSFVSAISKDLLELAGFAYVDDTDLIQTANDVTVAVKKMIDLLDFWTQLVEVTGGMLAPEKCWCYIVDFHFKRGRWQTIESHMENNIVICTRSGSHRPSRITQINTTEGSNMLGVIMSPNGENTHHVVFLRDKALQWASNIKATGTNMEEVWTALHRTFPSPSDTPYRQ
jgi:hypothetical protein